MSDDFGDFEGLEGLEDKDFELVVDDSEIVAVHEYDGPCGSCANCATGVQPLGAGLDNFEALLDISEVEFKANRSGFYVNGSGVQLHEGTAVIVEAERGLDFGTIAAAGEAVHDKRRSRGLVGQPMRKILRVANDQDMRQELENRGTEEKAEQVFNEKCAMRGLAMKLAAVEYQFDHARLTFYFTSVTRVDFRALVRDLAGIYRTRIELRQIGARDEAKKIGGLGICGREVCCTKWMSQIRRVNLDQARLQGLSLNPVRLAGACGRLKCCILFEMQSYIHSSGDFPALNTKVATPKGEGIVEKVDIFNDRIYLRYKAANMLEPVTLNEIKKFQALSTRDRAQNFER